LPGPARAAPDELSCIPFLTPGRGSIYRLMRPALAEIVGDGCPWTVLMVSLLSMPWSSMLVMPRLACELALDHDERHALMGHFDRVGVPE
jgi:hypothetical protein